MAKTEELFTARKSLDQICAVPDKIISVYSLEQHVWANSNSPEARKERKPEIKTIEEFQLDPVRPFLNDIFRNMAAPHKPDRRDNPVGQGYWIQAEFGSGKSHLLCLVAALSLGEKEAWDEIKEKEQKSGRGKRESLYRFWEEGLASKSSNGKKGVFVIVKTLVGTGGGTVGLADKGQRLSEYILEAAKEQIQIELGKNLSLYPTELLADRFISADSDRYRNDLRKFLRDPKFFDEDEFQDVDEFIQDIQQNKSPEYKRSCGNKLWRFYTEYLRVQPRIAAETEDILKHMVDVILAEGYSGVLLVLDEVSLFMKDRDENQRTDDEKTLVVLSNRLSRTHNLPVWTVCAAQQAIESKMGVKNIIADDRLKLVKLLEQDKDYYDIVLARVREIKDPGAIKNYYLHYKRGFTWPSAIGESEFSHFFPFHKPAIEVLRAITYELTTTRSAIHFMHMTLKHQIKSKGNELVRLWELFDEAVSYEEDPSGVHAGLVAIKTRRENEYRAYEVCKRQVDGLTKGSLKVHRDKALKAIQTLFLYYIARTRQNGLTPEEIANSVLIERDPEANPDENIQHYETLAENLKKELRQIVQSFDEDGRAKYRFEPVVTGVDPREEFRKARDEAESNEVMVGEAWQHLLGMDEWPIRTRQMTIDLSSGVRSIFRNVAPAVGFGKDKASLNRYDQNITINWQQREVEGLVSMRDLGRVAADNLSLPPIDSDATDLDFAFCIGTMPVSEANIKTILTRCKDPRTIIWSPGSLTQEEHGRLLDFAAYRKLVYTWQGKETEDAIAIISWVANSLKTDLPNIYKAVDNSYARGRMDAINNSQMTFSVVGELSGILPPVVSRVLGAAYESRDIKFDPPFLFRKEEGVKVINGIVKTGTIPKGTKPNQNISAAQNFGFGLQIFKKGADKKLDISDNRFVQDIMAFIESKLPDANQSMKIETIYKNFMGIGGPKDYGLSRRIIQIYLLCLVQQGKIRISVSSKAGITSPLIDYANVASVDFGAKTLDAFLNIYKMTKPENWEVLRPYAEKLLGESIPSTHDDAVISGYRAKLRQLFTQEKDEAVRIQTRANGLFETLKALNPYTTEVEQMVRLFGTDIQVGDDITLMLHSLKETFGYNAFDSSSSSQEEVDDLAIRLRNYRDVQRFVGFEMELRAIYAYCNHTLPDVRELHTARDLQNMLKSKLADLKTYITSEVKLKTELIGKIPAEPGETGTFGALIRDYTTVYAAYHDSTLTNIDGRNQEIQGILGSDRMKALKILEKVTALQPAISDNIERQANEAAAHLFACPVPSRDSIEGQLRNSPIHECGLTFENAPGYMETAKTALEKARNLFDAGFDRKMDVFLNPRVRERLQQGKKEPAIARLLACQDVKAVGDYLIKACLEDDSIVNTINRYLKLIVVKPIKVADFKPKSATVDKDHIVTVTQEFQEFLENQINSIGAGKDTIPMLQFE